MATQTITQDPVLRVKAIESSAESSVPFPEPLHYGDWPNDAGFNASMETLTAQELKVTGSFPFWAAGTLVRIGPGASRVSREGKDATDFQVSHWFDGFAHIHKFEVRPPTDQKSGSVYYQSRSQTDEAIEYARRTGRLEAISFAQKRDPCDTLYAKFKTFFKPIMVDRTLRRNVCVALQPAQHLQDKPSSGSSSHSKSQMLSATTDNNTTKEFDLETLEPHGLTSQNKLHPDLKGPFSCAHSCVDEETGDIFNYNLDLKSRATYRVFKTSTRTGKTEVLATINDPKIRGAYIHSMLMTKNYLILCVWGAYFARSGLAVLWERNFLDAIEPFDPSGKTMWIVVDRKNGRGVVQKFTSPAMFCFHAVNAWEEQRADGKVDIFTELCSFKDLAILHRFYYQNMLSSSKDALKYCGNEKIDTAVSLSRFKLANINEGLARKVLPQAELLFSYPAPQAGELPIINPKFRMSKHRYVYSVVDRGLSVFMDSIGKTDTVTGDCIWWTEDKCTPGEPIFVPNPNGSAEDDGVLLTVVLDGGKGTSFLLCLDARDLIEVARAHCEVPVALGFHGVHLPTVL